MKTKAIIRIILLIVAIKIISAIVFTVVEHFVNIDVLFYSALVLTLYVAYKGFKSDFAKKHHNKERNNAF